MTIRTVLHVSVSIALLAGAPSPLLPRALAQARAMQAGNETAKETQNNQSIGSSDNNKDSPLHACDKVTKEKDEISKDKSIDLGELDGPAIRVLELRSTGRVEEDLALVDGVNVDRAVLVVACRDVIWKKFSKVVPSGKRVFVQVRAWRKPPDGGWREIRLNEPTLKETYDTNPSLDSEGFFLAEVNLAIGEKTVGNPMLLVPLRRDAIKPEERIRIRIRIGPETELAPADPKADPKTIEGETSVKKTDNGKATSASNGTPSSSLIVENEEVIDQTYEVGRFGLHVRFSDMALFVQRLGEDRENSTGTNPVVFDSVNFRPAPGVYYGFNYYHRRHASIRMLEPGFGMHLVFLNWNDRPRGTTTADTDITQVTNLQIGIGITGSMFDGTVVGAFGWNLQVKDQRQ